MPTQWLGYKLFLMLLMSFQSVLKWFTRLSVWHAFCGYVYALILAQFLFCTVAPALWLSSVSCLLASSWHKNSLFPFRGNSGCWTQIYWHIFHISTGACFLQSSVNITNLEQHGCKPVCAFCCQFFFYIAKAVLRHPQYTLAVNSIALISHSNKSPFFLKGPSVRY